MKAKNLRRALITSAVALVLCLAMLVGSTYAWFTDSVTSTGNVISAGKLDIEAYYYDYDSNGTSIYQSTGNSAYTLALDSSLDPADYSNVYLSGSQKLSFNLSQTNNSLNGAEFIGDESANIEPGWSNAKLIKLVNEGSLNAKVKVNFSGSGYLEGALWFDFINVSYDSSTYTAIGSFTPRAMSTISTFASGMSYTLEPNQEIYFVVVYGMYTDADNTYQDKTYNLDVEVLATQGTGDEDGFGNGNYDTDATYSGSVLQSVASAADLTNALEEGNIAVLTSDVEVSTDGNSELYTLLNSASGDVDAVIDVSAADTKLTLTATNSAGTLDVTNGNTLTIIGSGDSSSVDLVAGNTTYTVANISVASGSSVTLEGVVVEATGSVLYPHGNAAEVNVINSTIYTTGVYCVATNSAYYENYNVEINIENSTLQAEASDEDSCVVMTNVASTLSISNSTIIGQRQGVVVRAGTATITDTVISCELETLSTYGSGSYFSTMQSRTTSAWADGNEVALGAVVVGNENGNTNGSYTAPAVLNMSGCTLSYDITDTTDYDEYEIGLFMVGDGTNGCSTSVTVSDCTINNKVIAYGGTGTYLTYSISDYTGTIYTTWNSSSSAWEN